MIIKREIIRGNIFLAAYWWQVSLQRASSCCQWRTSFTARTLRINLWWSRIPSEDSWAEWHRSFMIYISKRWNNVSRQWGKVPRYDLGYGYGCGWENLFCHACDPVMFPGLRNVNWIRLNVSFVWEKHGLFFFFFKEGSYSLSTRYKRFMDNKYDVVAEVVKKFKLFYSKYLLND